MASFVDRQRLREEFERLADHVESDDEARLAAPGVEGIVKLLATISEGQVFEVEQVRQVFQTKEWAEDVDVTCSDLEALVDTLLKNTPKVEKVSNEEKTSSTLIDDSFLSTAEDAARGKQSKVPSLSKADELHPEASRSSILPLYPIDLGASENEVKDRKRILQEITIEQSRAAEASIAEAYNSYRKSVGQEAASYLPDQPPTLFAAKHYYRILKEQVILKRPLVVIGKDLEKVPASPMKRTKKRSAEAEEISIAEMHSTAKVGAVVHLSGCLMGAEDDMRSVDVHYGAMAGMASSKVVNVVLADEGGSIQLTLWGQQAIDFFPLINDAMAAVPEDFCAKAHITNLVLRDVRFPGPKIRMLHSTVTTELVLNGTQKLEISPAAQLFPTMDFRELNKFSLPVMLHIRGIVTGETSERTTSKGAEQICFSLMDVNKRTVSCVGHDIPFPVTLFKAGMEVAIFYASVQEGLRNGPGNVWVYSNSYIVFLGSKVLPGIPIEAVCIRGKL